MNSRINEAALGLRKTKLPSFGPGDQVRVWCRIIERDKTRLAPFEGMVLRRRGSGLGETFSVRRITHGEGVERVFPIHAPVLEKVEVLTEARPPRARLYFLRTRIGKTKIASAQPGGPATKGPDHQTVRKSKPESEPEPEGSEQETPQTA